ncbi:MAG TPA: hypothetical protein VJM31_09445 [Vicinamibacterales bacterium]|nr:hypothetical protein [Vicinamibacterales bacterium]
MRGGTVATAANVSVAPHLLRDKGRTAAPAKVVSLGNEVKRWRTSTTTGYRLAA